MPLAALLAVLLALNVAWLFGFTSFLLGACLFPLTLGVWWGSRQRTATRSASRSLAVLLVLGYFGHLVSLGLTVVGLLVLAGDGPGAPTRAARLRATLVSMLPLIPLGLIYPSLTRRGGRMSPPVGSLDDPFSIRGRGRSNWSWVDPISLASKTSAAVHRSGRRPGAWGSRRSSGSWSRWASMGSPRSSRSGTRPRGPDSPVRDRGSLGGAGGLLLLGGLVVPDSLGSSHGHYLPQRVLLLGLVGARAGARPASRRDGLGRSVAPLALAAVPWRSSRWSSGTTPSTATARWARSCACGARSGAASGIATLLSHIRTPFRANPLLHADCLLGIGTGNIVWSNYETTYYYFPVQFRADSDRPAAPGVRGHRPRRRPGPSRPSAAKRWERLLERYHPDLSTSSSSGRATRASTRSIEPWFKPVFQAGKVQLLRRRASRRREGGASRDSSPASARTGWVESSTALNSVGRASLPGMLDADGQRVAVDLVNAKGHLARRLVGSVGHLEVGRAGLALESSLTLEANSWPLTVVFTFDPSKTQRDSTGHPGPRPTSPASASDRP